MCVVAGECGKRIALEKNVFQGLYPCHGINWCATIDVEREGGH